MRKIRDQRIVVTGGTGFLGRAVVARLREQGAAVFVFRSSEYDLRDRHQCRRLLADAHPEIVIHLAAVVGGIGANLADPGRFFYENAIMGIELIEASRLAKVEKFITTGTICAYPKFTAVPFREDEIWNGYPEETNAPYGLAKKMMLVQLQAYRKQYGFQGIYLLPVNLYGPYDNFDLESSHVIPAMIRKFCTAVDKGDREVILWGSGEVTREFLFVDDCARAIVAAASGYEGSEPVNIGAGFEIKVKDLAMLIAKLTGFAGAIVWDSNRPDGQPRRCLDTTRAATEFGFRSSVPLEAGLQATIEWWRNQTSSGAIVNSGTATKMEHPTV